ncbi:MAG: hypothetical protein KF888_08835 [Nitrosomonas sp.]|nr:hypothetical protein [Nitrosomonas sp.]
MAILPEFLQLLQQIKMMTESGDPKKLRENVKKKALGMDKKRLMKIVSSYAGARTKNFFEEALQSVGVSHG